MAFTKGLVAASATPLILSILSQGDSYGYAIIEEVRRMSDGELQWADGMLYPILHRLEKRRQVESYWGKSEIGRKRKYYRLSKSGSAELTEQRKHWKKLSLMLERLQGDEQCFS